MSFTEELEKRGAREFQIAALGVNEERAMSAIAEAERRGVEHVIPYALTLFDNPDWSSTGAKPRQSSNVHAEVQCQACGGNRFVVVTDDWSQLYGESYAPCRSCNADCNTTFWRVDGARVVSVPR